MSVVLATRHGLVDPSAPIHFPAPVPSHATTAVPAVLTISEKTN